MGILIKDENYYMQLILINTNHYTQRLKINMRWQMDGHGPHKDMIRLSHRL